MNKILFGLLWVLDKLGFVRELPAGCVGFSLKWPWEK